MITDFFIDGTVAGTPADLTIYKDVAEGYQLRDKTYYGRGCKNTWGTDGLGGSATPCPDSDAGGRYVTTADSETQKNGTYYHYQAATSGSGGSITTGNDAPDTFCPLGWQLPYSGTGGAYYDKSKSWNYLFNKYSIVDDETSATKVKSYPFSYVYSGFYFWGTGRLYNQSNGGLYWSSTVFSNTNAYLLSTWSSVVSPASTDNKADGVTVRCGFIVSIVTTVFSSTARWREQILRKLMPMAHMIIIITGMAAHLGMGMVAQQWHVHTV